MADEPLDDAINTEEAGDDWAAALADQDASKAPRSANFDELEDAGGAQTGSQNLDFLLDIPLEITVELGHTKMIINKMLQLTQGSVVELDKAAGEPVEIFVNHKLLGKGEVIVVNERFGIRITEIISQADRIKNIG
ncbi:MAG: flagellar motor switch protein FliN [Desulfobulbaceae bacterium]|nr:flagellar motor switch protein FliN [Desulfobulbaceae bacterium]HIJ77735.1 flagellar motor switch protein FliN [Deltaproteobacteria bacterium]